MITSARVKAKFVNKQPATEIPRRITSRECFEVRAENESFDARPIFNNFL